MIKVAVFDMGGVMVQDFHMSVGLMPFLGYGREDSIAMVDDGLTNMLAAHSRGEVTEDDFWRRYEAVTGRRVEEWRHGSLFGKFFHPRVDEAVARIAGALRAKGLRVVCGTNTFDAHYNHHVAHRQYDMFNEVYASHLLGVAKPDPQFFRRIAEAEGVRLQEMFFTDDSLLNVESAASIGVASHLFDGADGLRKALEGLGLL